MMTLQALIATVESAGNPHAIRFEQKYFDKIWGVYRDQRRINIEAGVARDRNKCSLVTGFMIASTSFGQFQMMGFNLYSREFDYPKDVATFLTSYGDQRDLFDKFVKNRGINFSIEDLANDPAKRMQFAMAYNGAAVYADRLEKELRKSWVF